jgi:hypothetical protein
MALTHWPVHSTGLTGDGKLRNFASHLLHRLICPRMKHTNVRGYLLSASEHASFPEPGPILSNTSSIRRRSAEDNLAPADLQVLPPATTTTNAPGIHVAHHMDTKQSQMHMATRKSPVAQQRSSITLTTSRSTKPDISVNIQWPLLIGLCTRQDF